MKCNKSLTGDATNKHCPLMEAHALGVISLSQFRTVNHTVFSSGCNVNDHSFSLVLSAQWGSAKLTLWMRAHSDIMPTRMCVFMYTCTHTYHSLTLGLKTYKSKAWNPKLGGLHFQHKYIFFTNTIFMVVPLTINPTSMNFMHYW